VRDDVAARMANRQGMLSGTSPHSHLDRAGQPPTSCPPPTHPVDRHQPWTSDANRQQRRRVEVRVPIAQSEVQPARGAPHGCPLSHLPSGDQAGRHDAAVRGQESVGMAYHHVPLPGNAAVERDGAGSRGPNLVTGARGVLDAAVTGAPLAGRRQERAAHRRVDRGQQAREGHQCGEDHRAPPGGVRSRHRQTGAIAGGSLPWCGSATPDSR